MNYITSFHFPTNDTEADFIYPNPNNPYMKDQKYVYMTCFNSYYPFKIFPEKGLSELYFSEPITLLYGTNGSGKTTALNVIAEKIKLSRDAIYNKTPFMDAYIDLCSFETDTGIPQNSKMITSDDVFNYMLNLRSVNQQIDLRRSELFALYDGGGVGNNRYYNNQYNLEMYERAQKTLGQCKSKSQFIKKNLTKNVREQSNGESAIMYFIQKIGDNALFLLDEPENSLSPEKQIQLAEYIEDSAKGCGCQFIIATHSPFLLAMKYSTVYDFDENPVKRKPWNQLENVQQYWRFFKSHESEF